MNEEEFLEKPPLVQQQEQLHQMDIDALEYLVKRIFTANSLEELLQQQR